MTQGDTSDGPFGVLLPGGGEPAPPAPEDEGPALHEEVRPLPRGSWLVPPAVFGILQGVGVLFAQDPVLSLGPAAIGAVTQAVGTFAERSYRWRVTSRNLVHGRLRWPFLRGGGTVALDRIGAVETTSARSGWGIKRAVDMGGDDVGRVPPWANGAVIVHVDAGEQGAHRVIIATSTAAAAEEMATVLRAVSGASAQPPQPPPTAEAAEPDQAPDLLRGAQRRETPRPHEGEQPPPYEGRQSPPDESEQSRQHKGEQPHRHEGGGAGRPAM